MNVDAYFMEYDTDRAGGFEPLRLLPKNKTAVLGVMTSKTGALESKDQLKRRLDEAARFAPLEQLCLSPQCGFASTEEGNLLAEDEQWAKLSRCVEVAREVWPRTGRKSDRARPLNLAPGLRGNFDDQAELLPLGFLGQDIAFLR